MNILELAELEKASESELYDADREEFRFIVAVGECQVPVLVQPTAKYEDTLLVTYNGAIQRTKAPDGIVFQRSSWLDEFESPVIQIADPTMVKHKRLQIGWAQYSKNDWSIAAMVKVIDAVRARFGLAGPARTLHYGSSAGGFQAICCATFDRGSKALVNNPQLDWSYYNERFVNALLRDVFEGGNIEDVRLSQPWRVSVVELFEVEGYIPETEVMLNIASAGDVQEQLKPTLEKMTKLVALGRVPLFTFGLYHDENMGHNPLARPHTVKKINSKLCSMRAVIGE
ncbi:hypothetical protein [Corynebacterium sp. HMSC05D03]|uniref:hypothetical protein n=1 Tax=Corynebacterium sp. HMSC05D03 TaxID=1581115 RepID=UPI0008A58DD4|nr:hypothetical protein [Corynebacterium sp. HMSC05D03]OFT65264.1 hypothetical protein HMPREF3147_08220 [Corynebacterium sp. HMSC05D03]